MSPFLILALQYHTRCMHRQLAHLLEHCSLVDLFSGDVTHLQDTQGKGFEGWFLNQIGVMDVQTGEHSLCQRVAL